MPLWCKNTLLVQQYLFFCVSKKKKLTLSSKKTTPTTVSENLPTLRSLLFSVPNNVEEFLYSAEQQAWRGVW